MIDDCKKVLKKYFGFDEFKGGQNLAITSVINKKDTLIIMPTGGGKSICYQLPAMIFEGITIVISPLIALMKDQVDYLNSIGIEATFINSSLSNNEINNRLYKASQGEFKLLYVAPERLESPSFIDRLDALKVSLIAVDEAHCVSHWGHDFRPSYTRISNFINGFSNRPVVMALTATATAQVREDIIKLLQLRTPEIHVTGFDRSNLCFSVIVGENKKEFIRNYIRQNKTNSGVIYASTRKEVENIYEFLIKEGYKAGLYHAGLSDEERIKMQEAFIYDDLDIMVATNAFGMGIDKSNVRYVIHYNMPKTIEAYYQEAGRAGRDGEAGECILLFNPGDLYIQKFFIDQSNLGEERKAFEYKKLQFMVDYCYTSTCLRKYILSYFGEEDIKDTCGNCSICNDSRELKDITLEAQMILSCVYRTQERYGKNIIIDVLKGSENKKVLDYGLNSVSTYGLMKSYKRENVQLILNKLIADGYLKLTESEYAVMKLSNKSSAVLKSREKVFMKLHKVETKVEIKEDLLSRLKELRKEISQREKIPPYVIFHDATLNEMCTVLPCSAIDFKGIKGVGERKLEKYGEDFISIIESYMLENNILKNNSKPEVVRAVTSKKEEKVKSHIVTYNLYSEGNSMEDISIEREIAITTVENHLVDCYLEGLEVDLDIFIPEGKEDIILNTIKSLGAITLKPIKEALPKEISYSAIKAVLYKYNYLKNEIAN
ncbi:MAG: DNA helicase RecQ [Clostridiaceae bacterium]|nr:DNA helicase RecQ [Clostridiaceae bacterium]